MITRINKTWLTFSFPSQIVKNRLKRYPKDRYNYYLPEYPTYQFNEEGN